jgi:hypothetical protein
MRNTFNLDSKHSCPPKIASDNKDGISKAYLQMNNTGLHGYKRLLEDLKRKSLSWNIERVLL